MASREEVIDLVTTIIKTQYFGKSGLLPKVEEVPPSAHFPRTKTRVSVGYGDKFSTSGNQTSLAVDFYDNSVSLSGNDKTFTYDQANELYRAVTEACKSQAKADGV